VRNKKELTMKQLTFSMLALGLLTLTTTAHAQAVIFRFTGSASVQDYFGGGGLDTQNLPGTVGTNFTDNVSTSAISPLGPGSASSSITGVALNNTMTMTLDGFSSSLFSDAGNFFIYTSGASSVLEAFVLGDPGTPYDISISAVGGTSLVDTVGSGGGSTTGWNSPGWLFTWALTGGIFSQSGTSDADVLTYNGQTYSRVKPMPGGDLSTFLGITGGFDHSGFASVHVSNTITTTVTNLGVGGGTSAPEPGTIVLFTVGGLAWLVRRRRVHKGN
jgi:PEP-CTERM motif